jgi:hypothetical protein
MFKKIPALDVYLRKNEKEVVFNFMGNYALLYEIIFVFLSFFKHKFTMQTVFLNYSIKQKTSQNRLPFLLINFSLRFL